MNMIYEQKLPNVSSVYEKYGENVETGKSPIGNGNLKKGETSHLKNFISLFSYFPIFIFPNFFSFLFSSSSPLIFVSLGKIFFENVPPTIPQNLISDLDPACPNHTRTCLFEKKCIPGGTPVRLRKIMLQVSGPAST